MSDNTYGSNKRTLIILLRCEQDLKIDTTLGEGGGGERSIHAAKNAQHNDSACGFAADQELQL